MPEISRFFGIIIRMYFDDHQPAHFHAFYGEFEAVINIETLAIIKGQLPPRALGLALEWASLHQSELKSFWEKAKKNENLGRIEPLK